jgi:hypothetical protein
MYQQHLGLLSRIIVGIKKRPFNFLTNAFVVYAAAWTILEPILAIVPNAEQYFSGKSKFFVLLLLSICAGIYKNAVPVEIKIKFKNSAIIVSFGDLFLPNGFKVIPVSRYFFETQVVPTSLQNNLIQMFAQGREGGRGVSVYEKSLSEALQNLRYEERYRDATNQEEKYYSLGTTAVLELKGQNYMLFSLTETELKGYIPHDNCNVLKMWVALDKFWQEARINARGSSINIPLIGSGVSGIRLNPSRVLEINLLAIANAIEEGGYITTEEVRIILHPKYIQDINLGDFQNLWQ